MISDILSLIHKGTDLSSDQTKAVFDLIFAGSVSKDDCAALLKGLAHKGETTEEIMGAALSMRASMTPLVLPSDLQAEIIDIVGTGGDHHGTLNISTATSLVVSACGVPVAKHGNRASTSKSGSSDVLAQLGVRLDVSSDCLQRCLHEAGIVFLFAPNHHPAMRHVIEVRRALGIRTIFNLLGPLTNPAGAQKHLIGVFDPKRLEQMALVLKSLGSQRGWIVCGHDNMDEMTTTGDTHVVSFSQLSDHLDCFDVSPEIVGLPLRNLEELKGDTPQENAAALKNLLAGEHGAYREIVLMNAAAALVIAGKASDLNAGVALAAEALDSGAALRKLDVLVKITN